MASIRSKHNNLLNYFICDHRHLSKAYVRKCEKFLEAHCNVRLKQERLVKGKEQEGWTYSSSPQAEIKK